MKTLRVLVGAGLVAGAAVLSAAGCRDHDDPSSTRGGGVQGGHGPGLREEGLLVPFAKNVQPEIDESSGLVRHAGAWWTLEDSGNPPVLWRSATADFAGAEKFQVPGAVNVDWEDLCVWDGDLLVCDVGDNLRRRTDLMLYRVRYIPGEPSRLDTVATYPVAWPDGPHDCEAVFVHEGKVHAITKDRGDGTKLFRFDSLLDPTQLAAGKRNVAVLAGELGAEQGEMVTSAAADPKTGQLVVLTYMRLLGWDLKSMDGPPRSSTLIGARQCESLAIDGDDIVFGNEQRDVFRVERYADWRYASLLPRLGRTTLGAAESDIPLQSRREGEIAHWHIDGDALRITARIAAKVTHATIEKSGTPGTGIALCFAARGALNTSDGATVLVCAMGPSSATPGSAGVWRLVTDAAGRRLEPLAGASCSIGRDGGFLKIDATIPEVVAFGNTLPPTFRFDLYAYDTGLDDGPRHSGPDLFAIGRPYLWGTCERK